MKCFNIQNVKFCQNILLTSLPHGQQRGHWAAGLQEQLLAFSKSILKTCATDLLHEDPPLSCIYGCNIYPAPPEVSER